MKTSKPTKHFLGELERLGPNGRDVMVLAVEARGFEKLSERQRVLAYYLYRAAIAGNKIAYHQSHRYAHDIKTLMEQVVLHADGLEESLTAAAHDYLKRVWIHHGQYDHYTHTKYVPDDLNPDDLPRAVHHAVSMGANLPTHLDETVDEMLSRLQPHIFDAAFEPIQTNQSEGDDIVATSAVNYWDPDVTGDDLEALDDEFRNRINVRFARSNGGVVPEVYKIGGLFDQELRTVSHFLRLALPYVESQEQGRSLETLLEFYETGDEEVFRRHCVHWLRSDANVDYLNGFIEVYLDPRGIIGQFEANVSFKAGSGLIDKLSDEALYFERRMPWPDEYRRTQINRPVANLVHVLVETGDAGPVSPAAYNLPNYNDIRRDEGSKNVILQNIENTWSRPLLEETVNAFFLPQYRDTVIRLARTLIRPLEVYMHEIIGHGSGQPDPSLTRDPRTLLGRTYSALEECRADLVALYHMPDPKLSELGAYPEEERDVVMETTYVYFLQGWFSRFDRVPGLEVREAHNKGNHAIFSYLVENAGNSLKDFGVEVVEQDGHFYVRVNDWRKVHEGIGELLINIQVIKSQGDRESAEALFDRFGTHLKAEWKEDVVRRKEKLNTPKIKAFVFPHLKPIVSDGEVVDVALCHDEDLTTQQFRFTRLENVTDIED